MKVLSYLNALTEAGASCYTALGMLEEDYGIKMREYRFNHDDIERGHNNILLFTLNYDQIKSSKYKTDKIVRECRSLVLEVVQNEGIYGEQELFKVVSRSFDRFFNIFEEDNNPKVEGLFAVEKMDGSLVGLFHYNGEWLYRTKSMVMPEISINGFETTWKEVIEESLGYPECCEGLDINCTYIFEVTSPENRVVVRYQDRRATLLAVRNNKSGNYL